MKVNAHTDTHGKSRFHQCAVQSFCTLWAGVVMVWDALGQQCDRAPPTELRGAPQWLIHTWRRHDAPGLMTDSCHSYLQGSTSVSSLTYLICFTSFVSLNCLYCRNLACQLSLLNFTFLPPLSNLSPLSNLTYLPSLTFWASNACLTCFIIHTCVHLSPLPVPPKLNSPMLLYFLHLFSCVSVLPCLT